MTGDARKQEEERGLFLRFAAVAGLEVNHETITQPDPPDIVCEVLGFGTVGFELTRIDSADDLKRMSLFTRSREFWCDALAELTAEERATLQELHGNAQVTLSMAPRTDQRQWRSAMRSVARKLLAIDADFRGNLFSKFDEACAGLTHASLLRTSGIIDGPAFNDFAVGFPERVRLERIDAKLSRDDYRDTGRLELVALARWGGSATHDTRDFTDYLAERVPGSPFSRAWIFDVFMNQVVARFP